MSNNSVDEETAKDIQEDLAQSDEDVSRWQRISAGVQLALLFGGVGAILVASVVTGYVDLHIDATATVDVGWIVEYLVAGVAAAFLVYVGTLIIIWLPGSVLNLLGGLAYGAASAAGYVQDDSE